MGKAPNPFLLGKKLEDRRAGGRAKRRAAEAKARKNGPDMSISTFAKMLKANRPTEDK